MTIKILIVLIAGILSGLYIIPESFYSSTTILLDVGLCLLLLFIGIEIGNNTKVFNHIKKLGFKIILVPLAIALGSIVGGIISSIILGINLNHGAAIGSGLGWYTLSAIMIAPYSSELSTIAFLSNVLREIIAIISIPLIAKKVGFIETIAASGATAMDTTLPIISRNTNEEIAVISFVSGLVMSIIVPFLVSFFLAL